MIKYIIFYLYKYIILINVYILFSMILQNSLVVKILEFNIFFSFCVCFSYVCIYNRICNCIYKKDIVYHGFRVLPVHEDDPLYMEIFPENTFLNEFLE